MWSTDREGLVLNPGEIKLFNNGNTFGKKIDFKNYKGKIRITTYSLPRVKYVEEMFGDRINSLYIIASAKFHYDAVKIVKAFPNLKIRLLPNTHAKIVLFEPKRTYIGSANFGNSTWIEATIGFESQDVYDFYLHKFNEMWKIGGKIKLL